MTCYRYVYAYMHIHVHMYIVYACTCVRADTYVVNEMYVSGCKMDGILLEGFSYIDAPIIGVTNTLTEQSLVSLCAYVRRAIVSRQPYSQPCVLLNV